MKYLYTLLALLVFAPAICQKNKYETGYVVKLKGDTIKGQINDARWNAPAATLDLLNNDGTVTRFEAAEVKSFIVSGRMYRSYLVSYDSTLDEIGTLSTNRSPALKTSHLFLKVILDANKSLLEYVDSNDRDHFFIEFDNNAEELEDHPFVFQQRGGDGRIAATTKQYLKQLQKYFVDCPNLKITNELPYSRKELKSLFAHYNSCVGRQPIRDFDHETNPKAAIAENYVAGSIVTMNGDTIKGKVNDELWEISPEEFEFKNSEGIIRVYKPTDVKAVVLPNGIYKSYLVSYDSARSDIGSLSSNPLPVFKTSHLFLKVLVAAKKSLLEYRADRVYFFIEFDGKVEELINHPFLAQQNGIRVIASTRLYISQLQRHFGDCLNLKGKSSLAYINTELKALFVKYNSCMSPQPVIDFDSTSNPKFVCEIVGDVAIEGYKGFSPSFGEGLGLIAGFSPSGKLYSTTFFTEIAYHKFPDQESLKTSYVKIKIGVQKQIAQSKAFYTIAGVMNFMDAQETGYNVYNIKYGAATVAGYMLGIGAWMSRNSALSLRYEKGLGGAYIGSTLGNFSSVQLAIIFKLK